MHKNRHFQAYHPYIQQMKLCPSPHQKFLAECYTVTNLPRHPTATIAAKCYSITNLPWHQTATIAANH